ncbi:MAG: AEC family transporter [Rhodovibrionaceae bacterium]
MLQILLVILPVFLLIFLGWVCRKRGFPGEGFWAPAEKLTYFILFPALLVATLAEADFSGLDLLPMALAVDGAILLMTALTLALKPLLGIDGPGFTSLYQGAIRMNSYIGLSVSYGLFGAAGLTAAALAVAAIVPLANVCCVLILARYGSAAQPTVLGVLKEFARNPLILGCVLGGLLNATGLGLPPVADDMLHILGRAALPLGLLAVGAALSLQAVKNVKALAFGITVLKLAVLPAITLGIALLLGVQGTALAVAVLFNALPTATSSYILARQLGGDAQLMAALVTLQTAASMLTIPLVLALVAAPA